MQPSSSKDRGRAEINRRNFAKSLGTAFVFGGAPFARAATESAVPTVYFVDGYHGGVKGHMPPGSWRDILNALRDNPQWKLCLDIEPASWDVLRREDPRAYRELKTYLTHQAVDARIEMVAGTFSQPYGWAVCGESNIRQLLLGRKIIREHFPDTYLGTYAVQEPCWASCLPQILKSLGYDGAVLKDPGTAWGGYSAGFDAETVKWVGPDGSAITTVPRYACEDLRKVYETEAADASPEYARKCVAHGIRHPTGMYFQDLGWAAKPKVSGNYIRNVTWREYLHNVADPPTKEWRFSIEDILTALPWGEKTLHVVAQQVRSAENRLLMAEKLAAMAFIEARSEWPEAQFQKAWEDLLWAQGHDSWITATTRAGRQAWAFQIASGTMNTENTANAIIAAAAQVLTPATEAAPEKPLGTQWVRVINTLCIPRDDLAELTFDTDRGTRGIRVLDAQGTEIPCQVIPTRRFGVARGNRDAPGADINSARVLFRPHIPAVGYATYRVEPLYDKEPAGSGGSAMARTEADGSVVVESDLYTLRLDPRRGGAVTSLVDKRLRKEFCDPASERLFNEYRGYFVTQKQWRSSSEEPARITITESGPLRAQVRVAGKVGGCPYMTTITLVDGQRRIDFDARFTFEQETWIGDPWDIKPENRRSEPRRSSNDGRWKLQALFPVTLKNHAIYKNAAYDVCRSRNSDTYFQRWDEIKHDIVTNWVDLVDEQDGKGLAVLSDRTTGYTHGPDHPLSLVMGWGWEGGFWWGKCPLKGVQQSSYAIIPHDGKWDHARLSEETSRWSEPLVPQILDGNPEHSGERSLVSLDGPGVEVPTVVVDGNHLMIRLFNAEGDGSERTISLGFKPSRIDLVELDGKLVRRLDVATAPHGRHTVKLAFPRFGIRTLRCELA